MARPAPPCAICKAPIVAHGFCDKHYRRWKKFGDPNATLRPPGWGEREKHPLYGQWTWTRRVRERREPRWDDFVTFVEDVGERPPGCRLKRRNVRAPWGPNNFYWAVVGIGPGDRLGAKAAYQRTWRAKNRAKVKGYDLKKGYGLSLEDFDALHEIQGGVCAICGKDKGTTLVVDHCHATNKVRGLLCHPCNRGLGMFKDNARLLANAIAYLTATRGRR